MRTSSKSTPIKLYLAGLFYFGLYADEDSQVLHHLSQFTGIRLSVFANVKHQTHRQTVLDVRTDTKNTEKEKNTF